MLGECFLDRVQRAVCRSEAFDSGYSSALSLNSQDEAGSDRHIIHHDRAGSAHSVLAP
jgi:hypothetical protein